MEAVTFGGYSNMTEDATQANSIFVNGGCHCGAVKIRVETEARVQVYRCNCTLCEMVGFEHLIVPASKFELLAGDGDITEYRFNTKVAQHLFCQHCGVKSFYVPRSNSDGFSVNFRCLDQSQFESVEFLDFDGQNWEQQASLEHLSKENPSVWISASCCLWVLESRSDHLHAR